MLIHQDIVLWALIYRLFPDEANCEELEHQEMPLEIMISRMVITVLMSRAVKLGKDTEAKYLKSILIQSIKEKKAIQPYFDPTTN